MKVVPDCPGPDCPMCSGETCARCGAGCWDKPNRPCEHDTSERHEKPPRPPFTPAVIALLAALLFALPARADDCVRDGDRVVCSAEGFALLIRRGIRVEHERDVCRADLDAAEAKRVAAVARAEVLEQMPQSSPWPWPWVAAGAGGALAVVLVTALLVR